MKLIPDFLKPEIQLHINKVKHEMEKAETDAILVASNANIYYTSGRFFRGFVYISFNHPAFWFVIKPAMYDNEEDVCFIRKPEQISEYLQEHAIPLPAAIAFENDDLSFSEIERLRKIFTGSKFVNGSSILKKARMVKTDWEISEMRTDGLHQANVYGRVKDCYHEGMTDLEFQIEIERQLRLEGSLGVSRVSGNLMEINLGSVISGDNADKPGPYEFTMGGSGVHPALPVGADNNEILTGHTVMIDMNGAFNGYQTDMTRVWSRGEISPLTKTAHECSIEILHTFETLAKPGLPVKNLYERALEIVEKAGLKDYFMGHKSQVGFIGHGVGIQLNELPVLTARSNDILAENMTIAIEPKFVIPHVGAVGVENTYVVKENGLENLTVFPEHIEKL